MFVQTLYSKLKHNGLLRWSAGTYLIDRQILSLVSKASESLDVYGRALALPFADSSFETGVSFQVLKHAPEPGLMIAEMSRVVARKRQSGVGHGEG